MTEILEIARIFVIFATMISGCLITILSVNKPKLTTECIASVLKAGYPQDCIRLIDNGSNNYSREIVEKKYPNIAVYRLEENRGYSGGFNFGLNSAFAEGAESVFFTTNDTELTPGAVQASLKSARDHGAEMIAPRIVLKNHPDEVDSLGGSFDRKTGTLKHHKTTDTESKLGKDEYIPGTALWMSKNAFEQTGGTDESYHTYWEDVDLSFRAFKLNIPMFRCEAAVVKHGVGQTCHKKPLYTTFYFQRNRIRFCRTHLSDEKWSVLAPEIAAELEALEQKWILAQDDRRLAYLQDLRAEIAK